MSLPVIVSIQVGTVRLFPYPVESGTKPEYWESGIVKSPCVGPVRLSVIGLEGDAQADLTNHGGPDKAVLGYSAEHYLRWKQELPEIDFSTGGFGENLTISGLDEHTCCVGDVYQCGDCQLQISQPRQPCWKLAERWRRSDLVKRVWQTSRAGWYFRVLQPGVLESGLSLMLLDRPLPNVTVAEALAARRQ